MELNEDDEKKKEISEDDKKLIEEAVNRHKRCLDSEDDNRARALEAIEFRNLQQWPDAIKRAREDDPEGARPCLVLDKTGQYLRQIENDQRQARPSIHIRPVDDKADVKTAKVIQGLIRNIEDQSRANTAYDTAFSHAIDGGFGYFRITTEYASDEAFYQDIIIKRIRNRFCVLLDSDRQELDGSDSKFGFIYEDMHKDIFEEEYPDAQFIEWDDEHIKQQPEWIKKDKIRVCEYYKIHETKEKIVLLNNDEIMNKKEYEDATFESHPELFTEPEAAPNEFAEINQGQEIYQLGESTTESDISSSFQRIPVVEPAPIKIGTRGKRTRIKKQLRWYKLTALEVLESRELPGKWIPIVEVIGNEIDIEGVSNKSGALFASMDSQRLYNYSASSYVEQVALQPKAPYIAADGQVEEYEDEWSTANQRNISVLKYNPISIDGVPLGAPQRQPMPGIAAGWAQGLQQFEHDIQSAMGLYNSNVGKEGAATSGKQEYLLQTKGETGTYHYQDNLSLSISHAGRIIVDMMPHYYDTKRVARVLGEDGIAEIVSLDPSIEMAYKKYKNNDEEEKEIYNINVGKYDVSVRTGASYSSKRQQVVDMLAQTINGNPEMMKLVGDLFFNNMDWDGADEVAARLKKMLPPELQEQDGDGEPNGEPNQELLMVIEQMKGQMQEIMQDKEAQKIKNDKDKNEIEWFKAKTDRMEAKGKGLEQFEQDVLFLKEAVTKILSMPAG